MKKYYYYDINGDCEAKSSEYVKLISEHPLPGFSKKYSGCSIGSNNIPTDTPLGKKIKVAFGDPRVFSCSVLSFSECVTKSKVVKNQIARVIEDFNGTPITLNYKGGKIWTTHRYLCLVEDLK